MGFAIVPWTDEKLAEELARYPHIEAAITSNPSDWTFEVDASCDEFPSSVFFKFKGDDKWDAWAPFVFMQNDHIIYYASELEILSEDLESENDFDAFVEFLESAGFQKV